MKSLVYIVIGIILLLGIAQIFQATQKPKTSTPVATASAVQTNIKTFDLSVKDGKLASGPEVIQVHEGDNVTINVTSDADQELHLHGYDKRLNLKKGVSLPLMFQANLTGRFIYELEDKKIDLGALEVLPK